MSGSRGPRAGLEPGPGWLRTTRVLRALWSFTVGCEGRCPRRLQRTRRSRAGQTGTRARIAGSIMSIVEDNRFHADRNPSAQPARGKPFGRAFSKSRVTSRCIMAARSAVYAWLGDCGAAQAPVIVALGGISAGRRVYSSDEPASAWWGDIVGPGSRLPAEQYRILSSISWVAAARPAARAVASRFRVSRATTRPSCCCGC